MPMFCEKCQVAMEYSYPSTYTCKTCGKTVTKEKFAVSNSLKVY